MTGPRSRFRENDDLPLRRGPVIKKRPPFSNARALITRKIMRSTRSSNAIGSLSTRVFETRTATGREQFAFLDRIVSQIFILFISNGEKIHSNVNVVM